MSSKAESAHGQGTRRSQRTPVPEAVPHIIKLLGPVSRSFQELVNPPQIVLIGPTGLELWTVDLKDHPARIELGLEAEVYKSSSPDFIYLRLTTTGNGVSNGGLKVEDRFQKGPFQDLIWVQFGPSPLPPGAQMIASSPQTLNEEGTYTSETGFEIGFTADAEVKIPGGETTVGAGAHATFHQSNTVTTTVKDFEVLNKSGSNYPGWAFWEFGMARSGTHSEGDYNRQDPRTIIDGWQAVWDPPKLAVSTLFPACQATWKFPPDFRSKITVKLDVYQRLTHVTSGGGRAVGHAHPRMIETFDLDFASLHETATN